MATKHTSTPTGAPSTLQTVAIIGTPLWIILATLLRAVISGEVAL